MGTALQDLIDNSSPGVMPGDAAAMTATELFYAQRRVNLKNADLIDGYHAKTGAVNDALQQGQYRLGDNFDPSMYPRVPVSYVLGDPQGPFAFRFEEQTGPPACPAVPMWSPNPRVTPGNVDIDLTKKDGAFYDAGPRDGVANGEVVTGPDGHKYLKLASYLGVNKATGAIPGWYLLQP